MTPDGDAGQRLAALDAAESFIVEAPAGSGKTELLTQRYLRLLATVEYPEQIVAITFTRKAAAEMRARVVSTLHAAAFDTAEVPPHRRTAVELADSVLAHSEVRGWSILEQHQRLRILTIDALNMNLARHLPITSSAIVSVGVTDDAERLYRRAATNTTRSLGENSALGDALRQLLDAADNSLARLEGWLAGCLPQRDAWIRLMQSGPERSLPEVVRRNLEALLHAELQRLRQLAGPALEARLAALLERLERPDGGAASACGDDTAPPADGHALETSAALESSAALETAAAPETSAALELWRSATALLLTRDGHWRKRFTRREGFAAEHRELKAAAVELSEACQAVPGLEQVLAGFARLPVNAPESGQAAVLHALTPVLKRLLAELRIAFAEAQAVDHTELALAALQALGAADAPSDLLLALDRRIEHILVDEFQDTSHLQWGLLERLTAGWEPGDGRTLFLVGDPMQSIYRFRDADVSLFVRARQNGVGDVRLQPLSLRVNYRSAAELVDWVNEVFGRVFARHGQIDTAQASFRFATSGLGSDPDALVDLHTAASRQDEIDRIVELVAEELRAAPGGSIGILVRSRSHLLGVRSALAHAGLAAHSVEIDSVIDTQLGMDLVGLSSALLHAGDRLAWLGLLRGPCCGIGWRDLLALGGPEPERTIWSLLNDESALQRLSADGRARADWLRARLAAGFGLRAGRPLGHWLRDCWLLIDGPACLEDERALALAEAFFVELGRLADRGDVDDPAELMARFARPAGGEAPAESGIEIMTIHRAKGLEFDTVILPGLSRSTSGSNDKLLLYNSFYDHNGEQLGVIAGRPAEDDSLVGFLRSVEQGREADERCRLVYVAATRARRKLHLIADLHAEGAPPRAGSLLATLWPGIEDAYADSAAALRSAGPPSRDEAGGTLAEAAAPELVELPLRRLEFPADVPFPDVGAESVRRPGSLRPEFEWVHPASVQVGTLIHRELQRWAERAAAARRLLAPDLNAARYRRELALLGVESRDLEQAAERVVEALSTVWSDPTGRWIVEPRAEASSELRLTLCNGDELEHLELDRSFVDDGVRWIIDYKTGRHLGADIEQFLDAEVERYRNQLERYAWAMRATDRRPIRVGLYFPLLGRFRDWAPEAAS